MQNEATNCRGQSPPMKVIFTLNLVGSKALGHKNVLSLDMPNQILIVCAFSSAWGICNNWVVALIIQSCQLEKVVSFKDLFTVSALHLHDSYYKSINSPTRSWMELPALRWLPLPHRESEQEVAKKKVWGCLVSICTTLKCHRVSMIISKH